MDDDKEWTAKSLREALAKYPDDMLVKFDGCDCCRTDSIGGIRTRTSENSGDYLIVQRYETPGKWREEVE